MEGNTESLEQQVPNGEGVSKEADSGVLVAHPRGSFPFISFAYSPPALEVPCSPYLADFGGNSNLFPFPFSACEIG